MVIGGDSCFDVCGFESQHHILYGQIITLICYKKIVIFFLKDENNRKSGRGWPIFFKKNCSLEDSSKGQNVLTLTDVLDLGAALRATEEKQITASR